MSCVTQSAVLPSAERYLILSVFGFRAPRGNQIQKMESIVLPQAECAPNAGDRVSRVNLANNNRFGADCSAPNPPGAIYFGGVIVS
jgi:hypothetical protein